MSLKKSFKCVIGDVCKCIDKKYSNGLGGFVERVLLINSGQKYIGDEGCLSGEWYDTEFNVFILKGPYYNTMIVSKNSVLDVP